MTETYQAVSEKVTQNRAEVCFKDGDDVYFKWEVIPPNIHDLCVEFVLSGLARIVQLAGYDAYLVFNSKDLPELDVEDYDVSG